MFHIIGNKNQKELRVLNSVIKQIDQLEPDMEKLTDQELRAKTDEFKTRLTEGKTLKDIMPEAFATIREASKRTLGIRPYPVQMMGGIVLNQGRIAQMNTGEGKTIACAAPAYLNALTGRGVHVVTVNEYLAKRDAEEIGKIHEFMGLTVGCVTHEMDSMQRKLEYAKDITYVTNNEIGFDYLRDNMADSKEEQVLRGLNYAIIDEVDSILIDEARTPLIISGQGAKSTRIYEACNVLARMLDRGEASGEFSKIEAVLGERIEESGDYIVNEKEKNVTLTEAGIKKVEKFFYIQNLSDPENLEIQHGILTALRAKDLMRRDKDYVVKDNEILIVDEFTGRIMPGRRYSDGLHQAIEAKEYVNIKRESRTLATITFQNFFNKYQKKAGMTGTAKTEEKEFRNIYGMDVVVIPPNRPVIRVDDEDKVYLTKKEKFDAVCQKIKEIHENGQPILVGTTSIDTSELLSGKLKHMGIAHSVLNAKNDALEADIISGAGQFGAVTIATNMAGRGTDIKLDEKAKNAGGLYVIGTERHDSRRIDDQLRGRSGRQGDPGHSRFYLSLEDNLFRLFGSDHMKEIFQKIGVNEGEAIHHRLLSKAIKNAQAKVEGNNFTTRESLLRYDEINNEQREAIYHEREMILADADMKSTIDMFISDVIGQMVEELPEDKKMGWKREDIAAKMTDTIPVDVNKLTDQELKKLSANGLKERLTTIAKEQYEQKEAEIGNPERMRMFERMVLLKTIDMKWSSHIDDMEKLKEGIRLYAYGQKDPVTEYKIQAYNMFEEMTRSIERETLRVLFRVAVH